MTVMVVMMIDQKTARANSAGIAQRYCLIDCTIGWACLDLWTTVLATGWRMGHVPAAYSCPIPAAFWPYSRFPSLTKNQTAPHPWPFDPTMPSLFKWIKSSRWVRSGGA